MITVTDIFAGAGGPTTGMAQVDGVIVDLFAGPGGWDEGLRMIGRTDVVGVEWDESACRTAEAAGHKRVRADVSALEPLDFVRGAALCDLLGISVADAIATHRCPSPPRRAKPGASRESGAGKPTAPTATPSPTAWRQATTPPTGPSGRTNARRSSASPSDGRANCAPSGSRWRRCPPCWGCGSTSRAILMASRVRAVAPPVPTHAEHPEGGDLFGGGHREPWVSMAEALGWGFDSEPSCTVSSGGAATGGAEPFANAGYRKRLASFVSAGVTGEGRPKDVQTQPADTITGKGTAYFLDRPAPTIVGTRRSKDGMIVGRQLPPGEGENVGGWGWADRPAPTPAWVEANLGAASASGWKIPLGEDPAVASTVPVVDVSGQETILTDAGTRWVHVTSDDRLPTWF